MLPVWVLLTPRDYLSAFMKIGMILFLVVGVIIVNPVVHMPAMTQYVAGGGPIVPGPLFPFAFITIACGAISGFHSLIATGTTPKMIDKDCDIRPIGYGAMLMEGLVGIMALVAVCTLNPGDYFAINTPPAVYATLDMHTVDLPNLEAQVRETVAGRADGAVSLAIGMAQVLSRLPGMSGLMDYWYHFAIMFEALFILTVIDAGTRVGRFLIGELLGRAIPPLARPDWIPGACITTTLLVLAWGYFIWTGSISTIWPMFGVANQLLASCRALGRDDDSGQQGQGPVHLGDARAALFSRDHHAHGRLYEREESVLGDGHRPERSAARHGVHPNDPDVDDDGARRRHPRRRPCTSGWPSGGPAAIPKRSANWRKWGGDVSSGTRRAGRPRFLRRQGPALARRAVAACDERVLGLMGRQHRTLLAR